MIYITKEQAAQVKYLLEQAMQGNHILFDPGTLRRVLTSADSDEAVDGADEHIEKIMSLKTLPQKRAYLERLPTETFAAVVRTYVNIVENTLIQAKNVKH